MSALVFGASAGLGRSLARTLAAKGHDVALVARDERDLAAEAAHIRTVYGVAADYRALDAGLPGVVDALASWSALSGVTQLCFPLGLSLDGDDGLLSPATAETLIAANLGAVVATVSHFLPQLLAANIGNIVGFGSVATYRGRSNNVVYAAAKRGLESYFESLRHRTAPTGVRVQFYRLGYLDTQMSFGRPLPFPKASPDAVAAQVVRNLGRDVGCKTVPGFWPPIGWMVKALPWPLYRRLNF